MILNISGRTDIVAFYTPWLMKRLKEGFVDVRNPFNPKLVSRIYFDDVEALMICTKNPLPILDYLKEIDKPILFHVTLTPYKNDIEVNVPSKKEIIEGIKKLSLTIGIDNLYLRYDPVFINNKYNLEYHKKAFERVCSLLDGYVKNIIISFIDDYKNVRNNKDELNYQEFNEVIYKEIGSSFSESATKHNMSVQTCFEDRNLCEYGFKKGECISFKKAYELTNKSYKKWSSRDCGCIQTVDIGYYNSCKHFCKYCYANYDEKKVQENYNLHNPNSSLLIGELENDDIIKIRRK